MNWCTLYHGKIPIKLHVLMWFTMVHGGQRIKLEFSRLLRTVVLQCMAWRLKTDRFGLGYDLLTQNMDFYSCYVLHSMVNSIFAYWCLVLHGRKRISSFHITPAEIIFPWVFHGNFDASCVIVTHCLHELRISWTLLVHFTSA